MADGSTMVLMFRSARRVRRGPSQLRDMAARGAWALRNLEEQAGLGRHLRAALAVLLTFALAPSLLLFYVVTSACRTLWCSLLEKRFPGVEPDRSPSVRAATDTRRNQGVVTVLVHVRGRCDPELIRQRVQVREEVLERRDAKGELCFPRLRAALTSRWGHYAWRPCEPHEFRLDSHVVVGSQHFRGRPVTDANIQDYMSDIVSKFLPVELPPWQLVLVPVSAAPSADPRFYALLRLHHLLVDEVNAIHALLQGDWGWGGPLVPRPRAISYVVNSVMGWTRDTWIKLRYDHDPAFNSGTSQGLLKLVLVLLFVVVDATNDVLSGKQGCTLMSALRAQLERRRVVTKRSFAGFGTLWLVRGLIQLVRSPTPRQLAFECAAEAAFWTRVALDGPRLVLGELLRSVASPPPPLVSLCGRRVERIAEAARVAPVEVLLAAACGALREHYRRQGCDTPAVPVQPLGASGVMLLPPEAATGVEDHPLAALQAVNARLAASRHQPALLLASSWLRHHLARMLPSLTVRLLLNCITRRYAAIIMTAAPQVLQSGAANLWGYTVDSVLLWRPPQSNISVSLSLVRLGPSVHLAVMADQQLWPHHAALPTAFLANLRAVAKALNVPRSPRTSPRPGTSSESANPELLRIEEERLVD
ncbi:hypothetical protein B566_EDAN004427 [Ephemera danica]|nr:hypothetical protein B566_EDAN004427 [Ephemera danica]